MLTPTLKLAGGASALLFVLLAAFFAVNMDVPPANAIDTLDGRTFEPRGVTALDTGVFVIGCIPFAMGDVGVLAAHRRRCEFWHGQGRRRVRHGRRRRRRSNPEVRRPPRARERRARRGLRALRGGGRERAARRLRGLNPVFLDDAGAEIRPDVHGRRRRVVDARILRLPRNASTARHPCRYYCRYVTIYKVCTGG